MYSSQRHFLRRLLRCFIYFTLCASRNHPFLDFYMFACILFANIVYNPVIQWDFCMNKWFLWVLQQEGMAHTHLPIIVRLKIHEETELTKKSIEKLASPPRCLEQPTFTSLNLSLGTSCMFCCFLKSMNSFCSSAKLLLTISNK